MKIPPNQGARCEKCGESLSYQIGSVVWQHKDNDLCPACEAQIAVDRSMRGLQVTNPSTPEYPGE